VQYFFFFWLVSPPLGPLPVASLCSSCGCEIYGLNFARLYFAAQYSVIDGRLSPRSPPTLVHRITQLLLLLVLKDTPASNGLMLECAVPTPKGQILWFGHLKKPAISEVHSASRFESRFNAGIYTPFLKKHLIQTKSPT